MCADDPTKVRTVNFPAYAGQVLRKKKIYGWLCWCLFLWFVSFGQAKEMNREVTLASMQCATYTVSGYFTTQGSCFYNVASVTSPMGTTWKDSVCVSVVSLCSTTDTTFADSTFSGNAIINNQSIFLANRFYINGNLTLNSCTVYTAAGAQLIVQNGGILTLNNTTLQACDTMWRGIEVLENGTTILNSSSIADAENGILLRNKGIIKSVNSNF